MSNAKKILIRGRCDAGFGSLNLVLGGLILGSLAYLGFRRWSPREASEVHRARELLKRFDDGIETVNHQLGVIRGCCEIAMMKDENGEPLRHRMDAAIETVTETSALIEHLLVDGQSQPSR